MAQTKKIANAISDRDENLVLRLIENIKDLDAFYIDAMPIFHYACSYNQEKVCKKIVEKGMKRDLLDSNGTSALLFCYAFRMQDLAIELIEKGNDVEKRNKYQVNLLSLVNKAKNSKVKNHLENMYRNKLFEIIDNHSTVLANCFHYNQGDLNLIDIINNYAAYC